MVRPLIENATLTADRPYAARSYITIRRPYLTSFGLASVALAIDR